MRRNPALTLALALAPSLCLGDAYVKAAWHYEERYHHGNLHPAYDLIQEWWFGKNKMTWIRHGFANLEGYAILPALWVTFDNDKNRILYSCSGGFLDPNAKYWIEIPMNSMSNEHLDPILIERLSRYELDGTVSLISGQGKRATYETTESLVSEKRRVLELRQTIQATTDVDFDWRLARELHAWVRGFFHPKKAFAEQQRMMQGFVWGSVLTRGEITAVYRVLEMSSREPPPGVYDVPRGFERRARLTYGDLNNLHKAIHAISW